MTLMAEDSVAAADPVADAAWVRVCSLDDLIAGRGVAALLNSEPQLQAAVFLTPSGALHAVGNLDPFTEACVISRGVCGSRNGVPTVASPLLKHVFDLRTGECIDGPAGPEPLTFLPVYPARVTEGSVYVSPHPLTQPTRE